MRQLILFFCVAVGVNVCAQSQQPSNGSVLQDKLPTDNALSDNRQADGVRILTLDECIAMAINHNASLTRADNDVLMAIEQRDEAKTKRLPTINAGATAFAASEGLVKMDIMGVPLTLLDNGVTANVSVLQPVYTGGQITNGNRLAELGVATSRLQRSLTESEVRLTTEKYYWQIVQLEERLRTLAALDKQVDRMRQDAQNAVEAGVRNRNDLLQVQLRQNELQATRIQVENGLKVVKDLLAQHTGVSEEFKLSEERRVKNEEFNGSSFTKQTNWLSPSAPTSGSSLFTLNSSLPKDSSLFPLPSSLQDLYVSPETALSSTNEYQLLGKQVEAEQLQCKLTEGKNRPTVAVGAVALAHNMMDDWQARVVGMVTVSVPLSPYLYGHHDVKRQQLKVRNAENTLRDQSELLIIRMRKAWNDLNDAYRQVELACEAIAQSQENLRLQTDQYQFGTTTISDLLDAQSLYQQACDRHVEASTNYEVKKREYLKATGR